MTAARDASAVAHGWFERLSRSLSWRAGSCAAATGGLGTSGAHVPSDHCYRWSPQTGWLSCRVGSKRASYRASRPRPAQFDALTFGRHRTRQPIARAVQIGVMRPDPRACPAA